MYNKNPTKVLIVDDEIHIVRALDFIFTHEGFAVKSAHNGSTALSIAEEFKPDVILLDVMMPDLDGLTVARSIRNNEHLNHTAIIFLTAKGASEDKMAGYDSGGEYYIVKPFDNQDIVQKVKDVIHINL